MQHDIEELEREKADLKERLKQISKKTLLDGLSRQSGAQSGIAAIVAGTAAGMGCLTTQAASVATCVTSY